LVSGLIHLWPFREFFIVDPLSQAVIGAALAMSLARKENLGTAGLAGALGGMVPDLDVLIRSSNDPLLGLVYHRHFTHALVMIPLVGGLTGWLLSLLPKWRALRREVVLFAILGAATHGLLDACTSYGTLLWWPFSHERVAWHMISIIDPIPTFSALILLLIALKRHSLMFARSGLVSFVVYLGLCILQRERASAIQDHLVTERGHVATRADVFPSIFNNVVYRSVYERERTFYVDAIRVAWWGGSSVRSGSTLDALDLEATKTTLQVSSPQRNDLHRFSWFADGYLAALPDGRIGDVRYAMVPASTVMLWGITLYPNDPQRHVAYWSGQPVDANERADFMRFVWSGQ
jgi:inner membrane protein